MAKTLLDGEERRKHQVLNVTLAVATCDDFHDHISRAVRVGAVANLGSYLQPTALGRFRSLC